MHPHVCLWRLEGEVVHHLPPSFVLGVEPPRIQLEMPAQVVRDHICQEGPFGGIVERGLAGDLLLPPHAILPLLDGVVEELEIFDLWGLQGPGHRSDLVVGRDRVESMLETAPSLGPIPAAPL